MMTVFMRRRSILEERVARTRVKVNPVKVYPRLPSGMATLTLEFVSSSELLVSLIVATLDLPDHRIRHANSVRDVKTLITSLHQE